MNVNKVVVITGAGRGIGAATAKLFAEQGYDICINYHNDHESAEKVAKDVRAFGVKCICVQADVSKEEEVEHLFTQVDQQLGAITTLVNNVGILQSQMRVQDMSAERINNILTTNITSYFLCSKQAIKRMSLEFGGSGGTIVNVSSGAARTGSPNEYVDYAASKGAIDTLTVGLSKELAAQGIRVNGVRPGLIYTDMHADGGDPNRVDRLKTNIPLGRGGEVEEVAEAIYWLASDKSSFSTGSIIDVTGGC
ncbi:oxidoreductase [Psychrosphaera saromensis]|uniref:3-oxoacyl-[acyl-carrier-protein] reductase FabG n=1 Tax=Psychrosphaera saromensis TaxID=716813 RepID=A0A2S7UT81_9GAMM|nr:SDR family oxidoreductase [Psychrosphaera saromensis]PQJ52732.1 NAD(P)-dependent oxidoreductase [Psychrosphaera saromensis]GHB70798.1 oxidoreductase [Psychrosphaera saromensis]GLQ13218.1 oxidoreductase [Psychrosphaera saromensis]